jgi:acetyltransferase
MSATLAQFSPLESSNREGKFMSQTRRLANLKRLLAPGSVAVVGASSAPDKAGYQALHALQRFQGEVHAVNPKSGKILGHSAHARWRRSASRSTWLSSPCRPPCVAAVKEAIATGCGGGLIMGGGFAESGEDGAALQEQLGQLCSESGFRLLGPNTAGFVNMSSLLSATFVAGREYIEAGHVAIVTQSSGINFLVTFMLHRLGMGVSCAVGVGNAIDTDVSDVLEFLADDPDTRAIALHIEAIPDGRRLFDTLRRVTPRKPVAALVVGREDIGEFAKSHTGNLVGSTPSSQRAAPAGAVTVDSTEALAAAAATLAASRRPPKCDPGFGVLTGQGGAGLIMLDWLKGANVPVPELGNAAASRIAALLPPMTYLKNPVDTARPGPTFPDVLRALIADPAIDAAIVFALHEPSTLSPESFMSGVRRDSGKPILFGTGGPEREVRPVLAALRAEGLHACESPESLARAAIVLAQDARAQWQLALPMDYTRAVGDSPVGDGVDEHAAKTLLDSLGIPTPQRFACASRAEALAAFHALPKPVVAKILAAEISHKTEAGGVHLKLADQTAFERALNALDAIPLQGERRYLIEAMAPPGVELIVGALRDPSFGATILVGIGGTIAEAIRDTATRIAPVAAQALDMLAELRAGALLDGWRGSPAVSRDALADSIVRLSHVLDERPDIRELEINPLRAYPDGVLALDALIG